MGSSGQITSLALHIDLESLSLEDPTASSFDPSSTTLTFTDTDEPLDVTLAVDFGMLADYDPAFNGDPNLARAWLTWEAGAPKLELRLFKDREPVILEEAPALLSEDTEVLPVNSVESSALAVTSVIPDEGADRSEESTIASHSSANNTAVFSALSTFGDGSSHVDSLPDADSPEFSAAPLQGAPAPLVLSNSSGVAVTDVIDSVTQSSASNRIKSVVLPQTAARIPEVRSALIAHLERVVGETDGQAQKTARELLNHLLRNEQELATLDQLKTEGRIKAKQEQARRGRMASKLIPPALDFDSPVEGTSIADALSGLAASGQAIAAVSREARSNNKVVDGARSHNQMVLNATNTGSGDGKKQDSSGQENEIFLDEEVVEESDTEIS